MGVPNEKLCLGINFGGILAATENDNNSTKITSLGYNAICKFLSGENVNSKWTKSYNRESKLAVLISVGKAAGRTLRIFYGTSRTGMALVRKAFIAHCLRYIDFEAK